MTDSEKLDAIEKAISTLLKDGTLAVHDYSKHIRDDKPETRIQSAHLWGRVSALDYLSKHVKYLRSLK